MLNIHPALLPAFKGLDTHARALAAGAKVHGATVHFVVPEMDSGPIIAQGAVAVRDDDTEESLAARVLDSRAPALSDGAATGRAGRGPHRQRPLLVDRAAPEGALLVPPDGH